MELRTQYVRIFTVRVHCRIFVNKAMNILVS